MLTIITWILVCIIVSIFWWYLIDVVIQVVKIGSVKKDKEE